MSELDTHYAPHPTGVATPRETGPVASVKAAVAGVAAGARDVAGDVGQTARETVDTARRKAGDAYDRTAEWTADQYESASRNTTYARRRTAAEFNRSRRNVERLVEDNPVMIGVAGLAAGLLLGALLPGTRRENKMFGRYADEVRDQGYRYARDLADQGRHFLEDNIQAAKPEAAGRPGEKKTGGIPAV